MSRIVLDTDIINKNNLVLDEAIVLLGIINNISFEEAFKSLMRKGFIDKKINLTNSNISYFATQNAIDVLDDIILAADDVVGKDEFVKRINNLIPLIQNCFPEGKKEGTNYYWRGNKTDIRRKLQSFFIKYGNSFTDEEIINATKNYVQGFNGQYRFMRLLQYFIWKEEIKDGIKSPISELASYIENAEQEINKKDDWTSAII